MYGPLSAAIVHRSESDIKRVLQISPQSIHEQNSRGQTPLHLSCSWPKGITLLFHHGGLELVDREDSNGALPLAYACAMRCSAAVRLILEADSALLLPHTVHLSDYLCAPDEINSHLQDALVDRRRRLMSLAITKLCRKDLEDLRVTDDRLLDEKAFNVYKALERKSVFIPSALRVPPYQTTVFHDDIITPAIGELLYKRGFLDVNGIDWSGVTPLMQLHHAQTAFLDPLLRRASWLVSKGANLQRKAEQSLYLPRGPNTTAAHYLCFWIGMVDGGRSASQIANKRLSKVLEQYALLLGKLFSSKLYDSCICACSSHGCTPAVTLLRSIMVENQLQADSQYNINLRVAIDTQLWMIGWFSTSLGDSHEAWQWLAQEIIRYETFEKLELTHTCCEKRGWHDLICTRHDSTEREEIRDEERLLIGKLETLVAEFTEKYTDSGVSLPEFLRGYWKTRMEEIEREEKPLDDEKIAKIEELGVVIHS